MLDQGVYRNAEDLARSRRDQAAARWRREAEEAEARLGPLHARRLGRVAFGVAGVLGFLLLLASASWSRTTQTRILVGAWPAMALAWLAARRLAPLAARRALAAVARPTADPWADLERLEAETADRLLERRIGALEPASARWPLVALSLLLPLSLHFLVYVALGGALASDDFDEWILVSLLFVGHCHLVLAYRAWRFPGRLSSARYGWHTLGWVVLSCALSWVLPVALFGGDTLAVFVGTTLVTMVVVFVTGVVFVPAMFGWMQRRVHAERDILGRPIR